MFARKIRSVFDRLLPSPTKKTAKIENKMAKAYKPGDKVFFKNFRAGKMHWEEGTVTKRIRQVIYDIKCEKFLRKHKQHWNQLRSRHTTEVTENTKEIPMEILYDSFEIPVPVSQHSPMDVSPNPRPEVPGCRTPPLQGGPRRKRLRKEINRLSPDPKKKKY